VINPFTAFKNSIVAENTIAISEIEVKKNILKAYENAYNAIALDIIKARKDLYYTSYLKQKALLKQIAKRLDEMKNTTGEYLKGAIERVAASATFIAIKDIEKASELAHKQGFYVDMCEEYIDTVFKDTFQHVAAHTDKLNADIKRIIQNEVMQVSQRAFVEGISVAKAAQMMQDLITAKLPNFTFIDKAGRSWDTGTYLGMLAETVLMTTRNEAYSNIATADGYDLVVITAHGAKDPCSKWEGKIVSLTGATKGYPTVMELKASGDIFHPRCKHSFYIYHPEQAKAKQALLNNQDELDKLLAQNNI
jgi:hypothetical protein